MKRKNLPPFRGAWNRLPEYLAQANEEIESLQVVSTFAGIVDIDQVDMTQGDSFIVGKKYVVDTLEEGDDFSNIGFVAEGDIFIATGTTPTTWTNDSHVVLQKEELVTFYNDLDIDLYVVRDSLNSVQIISPNNAFLSTKTFLTGVSAITIESTSVISINTQLGLKYLKLETYV